jgi:hypothetical protein
MNGFEISINLQFFVCATAEATELEAGALSTSLLLQKLNLKILS